MPTSIHIDDLMHRWEDVRRRGAKPSLEELCADCPHLVAELRARMDVVMAMEQIMGVTDHDPRKTMADPTVPIVAHVMPAIPGYEIIRIIDQGGMGVVYEARQLKLGRTVALKMISSLHLRAQLVARFSAEAAAAARLQHPNFVQIFEVGQVNGRPFYSMEYVPGGSLAERLRGKPFTPRDAAQLIETIARAVHAAHGRDIVHRDLKPANIMLTADGTPKIADFGLAKRLDDDSGHTHTGEVLGTPSYMAPEQAEGNKSAIGPATDVYAVGAILYELLAGKPPFLGTSPLDALRQVVSTEPIAPSQLAPALPRDLEAICLKCLEKAPAHRYVTAETLADDLRRFLDGQPVTARHIGSLQRLWKTIRRRPQAVALGGALAVLALVPVYLLSENYRAQQQVRARATEQAPLVREILQRNCYECHGQNPRKIQKFDILNQQQLLDSARRFVVPGAPGDSLLIQRIEDGSMPPEKLETHLPRVTEVELVLLRDWILGGAPALPAADIASPAPSVVPDSPVAAKTKAIFRKHCYECHKYDDAQGGIKILHHRLLVSVRKVVVPGDPEKSKLLQLLTTEDDEVRMPRDALPLSAQDIGTIRRWIEEGAPPFPKGE